MLNETQCDDAFSPEPFLEPTDKSVYEAGDAVAVRWYAGVIPKAWDRTGYTTKMTFDLFLLPYRSNNSTYGLLHNTTITFLNATADGVYWSYIPYAPCDATEIVYLWSIPRNFTALPEVTDNEYVAVVQNAAAPKTGFLPVDSSALVESSPFHIVPLPASSSSSSSSSSDTITTTGSSRGLSSGAKAGIAVGSIVGAVALILGAWLLYRKRMRVQTRITPSEDVYEVPGDGSGGFKDKVEIDGLQLPREAGSTPLHELEDSHSSRGQQDRGVISEMSA